MLGRLSRQGSGLRPALHAAGQLYSQAFFNRATFHFTDAQAMAPTGKDSAKVLGGLGVLTCRLHHAGPEPGLLVQRVVIGAAQLVDVHAGRCAHAAVVADEHVEILWEDGDTEHLSSPLHFCTLRLITHQPSLNVYHLYPVGLLI